MQNQEQFPSSVGPVIDVATPSTRKLRALGFMWVLLTLFPLVVINYLVFEAIGSDDPLLSTSNPVALLGSALMPFMAWFALGNAVQRFHAASTSDRYFRVGPGGISVSLPDDGGSAIFRFSFRTVAFDLPWSQIKTWYPYVHSINGIPTERSITFETLNGEKLKLKTFHFAEKQEQIAQRIEQARLLPVSVSVVEPTQPGTTTSLPKCIGEPSFEIKKKKDRVHEIDLRTIPANERDAQILKLAEILESKLPALCPGFKYSRKHYRPFPEWKNVLGIRLFVKQGLLNGYEIQMEPNDSECRKLTISMCSSSLVADFRKYVAIAVGITFFVISFVWLPSIQNWLGDFAQLAPLVLVAMCLGAMAGSAGLLQIPIALLRLIVSDSYKEELQKQQIKLGIQEAASAEFA